MFGNKKPFSSFSVNDIQRAKEFYGKILRLEVEEAPEGLELHLPGADMIFIYPKENHVPATFTILNFPVSNIDAAVDELSKRGVRFEKYKEGELRTDEKGIFRGEGPTMSMVQRPGR